jgi:hypothetical protein
MPICGLLLIEARQNFCARRFSITSDADWAETVTEHASIAQLAELDCASDLRETLGRATSP